MKVQPINIAYAKIEFFLLVWFFTNATEQIQKHSWKLHRRKSKPCLDKVIPGGYETGEYR